MRVRSRSTLLGSLALAIGAACAVAAGAQASAAAFTPAQAQCIRHDLPRRAAALLKGAKPTAAERKKLERCGVRPAGTGTTAGSGSGGRAAGSAAPAGAGLVDAGAYGTVRARTTAGGPAQPMDCTRSDGNQGFRVNEAFAADPRDPRRLYVGVEFDGFFVSSDAGATWTRSSKGLLGYPRLDAPARPCITELAALVLDPRNPRRLLLTKAGEPGTIADYFSENNGIYESKDGGASWKQILTKPGIGVYVKTGIVIAPGAPQTIYAGTTAVPRRLDGGSKVYVKRGLVLATRDGGATWAELPTGVSENASVRGVFVAPGDPKVLLVATVGRSLAPAGGEPTFSAALGLIRSTDGGATWSRVDTLGSTSFASISAGGPLLQHVVGGTYAGQVLASADGGATFTRATFNGSAVLVRLDPADTAGLRGLGADSTGGLYATPDGGATWTGAGSIPAAAGLSPRVTWVEWGADGTWYAAGHYTGNAGGQPKQEPFVFRSADRGATWTRIVSPASLPR